VALKKQGEGSRHVECGSAAAAFIPGASAIDPAAAHWRNAPMNPAWKLLRSSLLSLCLFVAGSGSALAAEYYPPPDRDGGWRTAAGAAQIRSAAGMEAGRLEQAWTFTQRCTQNAGLLVVRNGWLVLERYVGRASRNANPDMASTGKAYTSIACGLMLEEFRDRIPDGLDTKVFTSRYLPEAFSADGKLDDPRRAVITLGQLLCMTAGYNGEGGAPTAVVMGRAWPLKPSPGQNIRDVDGSSLRCAMWTNAGAGYSYSSPAPHIASMVLRRVTGMELDKYIDERLAKPMGWGPWGYCLNRGGFRMPHANGAGSIAVHATDALRFGYCLLRNGRWGERQLVPASYIALCNRMSPHNPHSPYTLMFEQNSDGHVIGAPRDAYWKSGAGGFGLMVVPSLDLVIYKMGGNNGQYDPTLTDVPQPEARTDRDDWKPISGTPFQEPSRGGDDGLRRVLEMVCAAVVPQ
jgi:CubicO group peptidase (beta-lactamase class C family)